MKSRFEGTVGRRHLIDALREQRIVEHDATLATALADAGELIDYAVNAELMNQGSTDNDLYLLLIGGVRVMVNGRVIAERRERESIGEMSLVSPSAVRSASVVASKPTVALRISESAFNDISDRFPRIWKAVASIVAERLRERERFHKTPNPMPVLFIGSSTEGLPIAQEIVAGLKHDKVNAQTWSRPGLFSPGGVSIDILLQEVEASDFATFVFGPDDKVASRGVDQHAPRDNVVFELGLFMGRLDRTRTFIVKEQGSDVKIPTDLLGVTPIAYVIKPGKDLASAMSSVCHELRTTISRLGVR